MHKYHCTYNTLDPTKSLKGLGIHVCEIYSAVANCLRILSLQTYVCHCLKAFLSFSFITLVVEKVFEGQHPSNLLDQRRPTGIFLLRHGSKEKCPKFFRCYRNGLVQDKKLKRFKRGNLTNVRVIICSFFYDVSLVIERKVVVVVVNRSWSARCIKTASPDSYL